EGANERSLPLPLLLLLSRVEPYYGGGVRAVAVCAQLEQIINGVEILSSTLISAKKIHRAHVGKRAFAGRQHNLWHVSAADRLVFPAASLSKRR
ncbi:unnamed protein product, partial [Ectocarpus sp. 12 AP-2014]